MSKKRPKIEGWLCYKNDSPTGQTYIRLTSDLMNCDRFLNLNPLTQIIYLQMCLAAVGKIEFIFPHAKYRKLCSKGGFAKAEAELISNGFIEKLESGRFTRTPNKYRFSFRWKS